MGNGVFVTAERGRALEHFREDTPEPTLSPGWGATSDPSMVGIGAAGCWARRGLCPSDSFASGPLAESLLVNR